MYEPSPYDPFVRVDWRWERARWLRENSKYARKDKEDPFVCVARVFQAEEQRARDNVGRLNLEAKYPGVYYAWDLWRRPDCRERYALEAYLLGRATPEQIAEYCHMAPETVTWYEKLFFNVLPRLKHDTYIINSVMGPAVHHGVTERDHDLLWKMVGYAAGHVVLNDWLQPMTPSFIRDKDQIQTYYRTAIEAKAHKKVLLGIQTLPVFNNQQILFEAYDRIRQMERMGGGSEVESMMVNNVQAALCALPFLVGRQGPMDLPRLAHYDGQSAELRASEQMQLALGQETERHKHILSWKYPEQSVQPQPSNP